MCQIASARRRARSGRPSARAAFPAGSATDRAPWRSQNKRASFPAGETCPA